MRFFNTDQALEYIGERIAQRKAASTHLHHALGVCRPWALLTPQASSLGILDAKLGNHWLAIFSLGNADGHRVGCAFAFEEFFNVFADCAGLHQRHHCIAVHAGLAVDHSNILQGLHGCQPHLIAPLHADQDVLGLALVGLGHHAGAGQHVAELDGLGQRCWRKASVSGC